MTGLDVDDFHEALDRFYGHQPEIEKKWFRYHKGTQCRIYLYDVTSFYLEGTQNE